jgi:hypothetical protein
MLFFAEQALMLGFPMEGIERLPFPVFRLIQNLRIDSTFFFFFSTTAFGDCRMVRVGARAEDD